MLHDLRYALRALRSSRGFTATAVATLALGVGVTIAMYSVVHATLVRPLPYAEPHRIFAVVPQDRSGEWTGSSIDLVDALAASGAFEALAPTMNSLERFVGGGDPEDLYGFAAPASFFRVMASPALGRPYRDGERDAIVVTHAFWVRRLGADPGVIGQTLIFEPDAVRVVGIMPPEFLFGTDTSFLRPPDQASLERGHHGPGAFEVFGRLRGGISREQAQERADVVMTGLRAAHPSAYDGLRVRLVPLQSFMYYGLDEILLLLLGAVSFVLVIACANVSALLMVRAMAREPHRAIRSSLGASRWRLVREHVAEAVVLAAAAAILGIVLAHGVLAGILQLIPVAFPRINDVRIDGVIAAIACACALVSAIAAATWPAMAASRTDVAVLLARRQHSETALRGALNAMVGMEVSLAMTLLAGAGVMTLSLYRLVTVDSGISPDALTVAEIRPGPGSRPPQRAELLTEVAADLATIPAVDGVTIASLPPVGTSFATGMLDPRGEPIPPDTARGRQNNILWRAALPSYFEVLGIPILRGRPFTGREPPGAPLAIVINEAAVPLFAGADPVGRRVTLRLLSRQYDAEVTGVTRNVRAALWRDPQPEIIVSLQQVPPAAATVIVQSPLALAILAPAITRAVTAIDPRQPVARIRSFEQMIAAQQVGLRLRASLLTGFAACGVPLTLLGVWSVAAYVATRRTREIGIRLALGARRTHIVSLLFRQLAAPVAMGIALGLTVASSLARYVEGWLFQVAAVDLRVYTAMAALLALAAVAATLVPARRAMAVDPATTLRAE